MIEVSQLVSEQLIGELCHNFRFVEGGTLVLYFTPKNEKGVSSKRLLIDCAWRMLKDNIIQIGSLDESEDVLNSLQQVSGLKLEALTVCKFSGDLRLVFMQGVVIDTFGYSIGSELWEFRRADGLRIGIGPTFQPFERMETAD